MLKKVERSFVPIIKNKFVKEYRDFINQFYVQIYAMMANFNHKESNKINRKGISGKYTFAMRTSEKIIGLPTTGKNPKGTRGNQCAVRFYSDSIDKLLSIASLCII